MLRPTPSIFASSQPAPTFWSASTRDITWDRPLFRPPFLPNPRVIFDPLPFIAQRLTPPAQRTAQR